MDYIKRCASDEALAQAMLDPNIRVALHPYWKVHEGRRPAIYLVVDLVFATEMEHCRCGASMIESVGGMTAQFNKGTPYIETACRWPLFDASTDEYRKASEDLGAFARDHSTVLEQYYERVYQGIEKGLREGS